MALFGGSDTRINATFTATDHATPVVRGLRAEFQKLGTKTGGPLGGILGGLGALPTPLIAGTAAFTGLVAVGNLAGDALNGFLEAGLKGQEVQARLNASLDANVQGWQKYQQAIDDATQSGVHLGFADDELQNSIAQLVPFTHDVSQALTIQSVAMDLARLKGISLADASSALGKAFSGNTTGLRRMGVAIQTGVRGMDAIAEAEKTAAGQADAFGKTFAGATSRMGAEVDRLQQDIGMKLVPAFTDALNSVDDFVFGVQTATDSVAALSYNVYPDMKKVVQAVTELGNEGRNALRERFHDMAASALQLDGDIADNIRANKDLVGNAMKDLTYAMDHPLKLEREKARVAGALTSKQLGIGLHSMNPYIRAVAEQQQALLEGEWETLTGNAWDAGAQAGAAWLQGYAGQAALGGAAYRRAYRRRYHQQHPGHGGGGGGGGGNNSRPNAPGAGGNDEHIHIHIDGKQVAEVVNNRWGMAWSNAGTGRSRN